MASFSALRLLPLQLMPTLCFPAATGVDQEPCYELPFQGLVPPDPSFEDMRRLVVIERRQPTIPNWWHQDEVSFHAHMDTGGRPTIM